MAQNPLGPPPPVKQDAVFDRWIRNVYQRIASAGQIIWSQIDFTGSTLTDLVTRNHADLQNLNTASYTHLTAANHTDLTDAGDSTLHYHATDRALANATGTLALANGGTGASLTDPGADRIGFWDDSAGAFTWLTAGSGLTITDTTMTASGSGGDVKGPASATADSLARFDGTTGKLLKDGAVIGTDVASLAANTFTGEQIISVNSSSDAFRITQTGAGNALVVEDSANPDSTPFVIDANGKVVSGHTAAYIAAAALSPQIAAVGSAAGTASIGVARFSNDVSQGYCTFTKSRSTTLGSFGSVVSSGDSIGTLLWTADDGTSAIQAASISALIDGTPGTNDMPGRLVFSTTADGASSPTERMRIDSSGNVGIGTTPAAGRRFLLSGPFTGATGCYAALVSGVVKSDVTSSCYGVTTSVATEAASFNITNLTHFVASQGTIGAGSTVTNQYGFYVGSTLTGAANNFGFRSDLPTSSGRWNFYANGTAPNYFAGDVRSNTVVTQATSPTNSDTTATATASSLLGGIRTGTPTGAIDLQLPTGTNMDAAFQNLQTNQSFEWSVINLAGATYAITVTANTNHAVTGNMIVDASKSGRFLTRKDATNTFTTYRIA